MMRLGADQRLKKPCACLACGEMLDVAAEVEQQTGIPLPLIAIVTTMCVSCGHVQAFVGDDLRELTAAEADRIDRDERVIALRAARKALLS